MLMVPQKSLEIRIQEETALSHWDHQTLKSRLRKSNGYTWVSLLVVQYTEHSSTLIICFLFKWCAIMVLIILY